MTLVPKRLMPANGLESLTIDIHGLGLCLRPLPTSWDFGTWTLNPKLKA